MDVRDAGRRNIAKMSGEGTWWMCSESFRRMYEETLARSCGGKVKVSGHRVRPIQKLRPTDR
jgi:hypothetical protein